MTKRKNPFEVCEGGWILNINKPVGKTSFAVVSYIRKLFNIKKVGHAGTLDPAAEGVLIVAVGKATKKVESFMDLEKEYRGTVKFGVVTDTYDSEGRIVEENEVADLSFSRIENKLQEFSGKIMQTPPLFSALKHKGKPLYKYARKGEKIIPKPREINIYKIDLESFAENEAVIRIICSRGTYIRSIAYDLGRKLGCGAMLSGLVRVRIGDYHIDDAVTWDDLPKRVKEVLKNQYGSNQDN